MSPLLHLILPCPTLVESVVVAEIQGRVPKPFGTTEYLWWMGKHSRRIPKCRGRRSKLFQGRPESYEGVNIKWNSLSSHGLQCESGFFALSRYWRSKGKRTFWSKPYPRLLTEYRRARRHGFEQLRSYALLLGQHEKQFRRCFYERRLQFVRSSSQRWPEHVCLWEFGYCSTVCPERLLANTLLISIDHGETWAEQWK